MNKTSLNLVLALVLSVSAFAVENIFSISTSITDSYVDYGYKRGALTIKGHAVTKNDVVTDEVQLRIEHLRKVGSSVRPRLYIASVNKGAALPATSTVYRSNDAWQRVGSKSAGDIDLNVADETSMSGTFLKNSFTANVESNEE